MTDVEPVGAGTFMDPLEIAYSDLKPACTIQVTKLVEAKHDITLWQAKIGPFIARGPSPFWCLHALDQQTGIFRGGFELHGYN